MKKKVVSLLAALSIVSVASVPAFAASYDGSNDQVIAPDSAKYASFVINVTDDVKSMIQMSGSAVDNKDYTQLSKISEVSADMLHDMSLILPPDGFDNVSYHLLTSVQYAKLAFDSMRNYVDSGDSAYMRYALYDLKKSTEYNHLMQNDLKVHYNVK